MSSFWDRLKGFFGAPESQGDEAALERAVRAQLLAHAAKGEPFTALAVANAVTEHDPQRTPDDLREASLLVTKLFTEGLLAPFGYVHTGVQYEVRAPAPQTAPTAARGTPAQGRPAVGQDELEQAVRKAVHRRVAAGEEVDPAAIAREVAPGNDAARFARAKDFAAKLASTMLSGLGYVPGNHGIWSRLGGPTPPPAPAVVSPPPAPVGPGPVTSRPAPVPTSGRRADAYASNPEIMGLTAAQLRERALKIDPYRTAWIGRVDTIPPQSDPRTAFIDRGLVLRGLLTEKQLAEIHTVGDKWLRHHEADKLAQAVAQRSAEALVAQLKAERAAAKQKKKAEAAAREQARREGVAKRKAEDIIYLGRGVSHGLADRRANVEQLTALGLPVFSTPAEVAQAMGLTIPRLRWLCFHAEAAARTHYHYSKIPKRSGGLRLIAAPTPALKAAQHWLLGTVLEKVPVDERAHGFVAFRSTVTNAREHLGREVVVNLDLKDFFPTVSVRRVRGLFKSFGYSPAVATIFAQLCTEAPRRLIEYDGVRYWVAVGERCLPQGAPTSPAISNLVSRHLDRRLHGRLGKRGWTYTRYADDLTFSKGSFSRAELGFLHATVRHVVDEEGFALNPKKGRVLARSTRQEVTGVVVNVHPSLPRAELRKLRALLHQAAKTGLEAQNREGRPDFRRYLEGKIAYVSMVDPVKGKKLKAALDALTAP